MPADLWANQSMTETDLWCYGLDRYGLVLQSFGLGC